MKNKIVLILTLIVFLGSLSIALADEGMPASLKKQVNPALNREEPKKETEEKGIEIPDWVKRTNVAFEAGTDMRPKFFFETIQPLLGSQHKATVLFNQIRMSERSGRPIYNFGLGARKIFKNAYLLGTNFFYDYQDLHKHSRAGVGMEMLSDKGLEARVNSYIAISGQRLVAEDSVNSYYEKVANGLDWELGGPLPYIPTLKLYGGGYWYNFSHFKNKYGWKMRMEFTPMPYTRLTYELFDDTKRNKPGSRVEGAITLAFTSFSLRDIVNDIKSPKTQAYPKINLEDRVLDRVVRDFDITVIKTTKAKATGLTIEGGKAS